MSKFVVTSNNLFAICITPLFDSKKYFIFRDTQYEFDFYLFTKNSNFFYINKDQYEHIKLINLFNEKEINQFQDISDNAIIKFIKLVQNEKCEIDNNELFYIQFLAYKYEVTELSKSISNLITMNNKNLIIDSCLFKLRGNSVV